MAESQVPYLYDGIEDSLIKDLSKARFTPYIISAGHDKHYAFSLYLYNARLSKAFLYPLHILEVTLRNRMSDIFSSEFGDEWYDERAFRSALSGQSLDALDRGIDRAKKRKKADIVATLTFDFWSNLFRSEYDRSFWQKNMSILLPNTSKIRKEFEKVVRDINDLRNRIAHYEPIHKQNLSQMHADIITTLSWLSTDISHWVKHYSTVNECLRMKPTSHSVNGTLVHERCDNNFQIVSFNDCITKIQDSHFTLCVDPQNNIASVVNHAHLAKYLMSYAENDELMLELKSHTLTHLIEKIDLKNNMILCEAHEPFSTIDKYFKKRIKFLIVLDQDKTLGVIEKSHRRY